MREVAEHAGVSIATVSFVVNSSKPVAPATRARIERSMLELRYSPNVVARALASRRTRILALVYPALEHQLGGSAMDFVTSAARAASTRDYHVVLWPVSNDGAELATLLGQGLVDGVLLMEVQVSDARVDALRARQIPFALIGRTADPAGLAHVDIDFETTVVAALDHLQQLGHRRIVLVSGSQQAGFRDYGPYVRITGAYQRLVAERGLSAQVLECEQTAAAGRALADRLSADAPAATAVMIVNEYAALGLVAGLHARGVAIPGDLSVMSLMTSREMASFAEPTLSVLASPADELGALGVEALIRQLEGEPALPPQLKPCVLAPGGSTGPARAS